MNYIPIDEFEKTGLVRTFSTTVDKYGWRNTPERDAECYRRVARHFGLGQNQLVGFNLAHTSKVCAVDEKNGGEGVFFPSDKGDYDGIITDKKGLMLTTVSADCIPVFFLDPVKKAIGMIHSGWRGTAGGISAGAVMLMMETYGSDPSDIMAAFGPCICKECYEVSNSLKSEFLSGFSKAETDSFFKPSRPGHSLLDLTGAARSSLIRAGVRPENIIGQKHCTFHEDLFYSWRRQQKTGGEKNDFLSGIMLV